jgi:hypothetical protein
MFHGNRYIEKRCESNPYPGYFPYISNTYSTKHIQRAHHAQPQDHRAPKAYIIQHPLTLNPLRSLQHYNRELTHLRQKSIASNLLRDTSHDDFVPDGTDEECDKGRHGTSNMRSRGAVDVASEEVVDGDVPLTRKLEPIGTVPPVGVEVSVGKAWGCQLET